MYLKFEVGLTKGLYLACIKSPLYLPMLATSASSNESCQTSFLLAATSLVLVLQLLTIGHFYHVDEMAALELSRGSDLSEICAVLVYHEITRVSS